VSLQAIGQTAGSRSSLNTRVTDATGSRHWYAVFTVPRSEKSVVRHLEIRGIESFLPTYEAQRIWKNRQRIKVVLPLFPTYLFVNIDSTERTKVLQSPGVLKIVGDRRKGIPIPESEVEFLRSGICRRLIEPYREVVIGERVRIKSGVMHGLQGTLVRKKNGLRFVLTVGVINQHAAIEIDAEDLEPIVA